MKTNRLYGMMAALLMIAFGAYAQEAEEHEIKLICETEGINEENVAEKCRFEGQGTQSTKDFLYEMSVGDTVTWEAAGSNGERINVVRIGYLSGARVFDWDEKGASSNAPGRVSGTPNNTGEFVYSISIVIPSVSSGALTIDPVLRVGG